MKVREIVQGARQGVRSSLRSAIAVAVAPLILSLFAQPARAQSTALSPPPPLRSFVDANGVDLISGSFTVADTQVSVGDPRFGGLSRIYYGTLYRDNFYGAVNQNAAGTLYTVSVGNQSLTFAYASGVFTGQQGDGSTLTYDGTSFYTLTMHDGTVATFDSRYTSALYVLATAGLIVSLRRPTGETLSYSYKYVTFTGPPEPKLAPRLQSVNSNLGYQIKYSYLASGGSANAGVVSGVTAINNAVDACDPNADGCVSNGLFSGL